MMLERKMKLRFVLERENFGQKDWVVVGCGTEKTSLWVLRTTVAWESEFSYVLFIRNIMC